MGRPRCGRSFRRRIFHLGVAGLAACAPAAAWPAEAQDAIVTDRPNFVDSSLTVGTGVLQIETGLAGAWDREAGRKATAWNLPVLLRYGLSRTFELRLDTAGPSRAAVREGGVRNRSEGMADLALSVKWKPKAGASGALSQAWVFQADFETGTAGFQGDGTRPSVRYVAEWSLGRGQAWGLGVMPGLRWDRAGGDRFTSGFLGVALSRSAGSRGAWFVELASSQIAAERHGGTSAQFDVGGTWQIGPDVQLDVMVSAGLDEPAPDLAAGAGVSFRF